MKITKTPPKPAPERVIYIQEGITGNTVGQHTVKNHPNKQTDLDFFVTKSKKILQKGPNPVRKSKKRLQKGVKLPVKGLNLIHKACFFGVKPHKPAAVAYKNEQETKIPIQIGQN